MPKKSRLAAVAWWLLLAMPATAEERVFGGRADVVLVEVPVVVTTAEGEPVRGLGRHDFELFDDGRRQTIADFQVVDLENLDRSPTAETLWLAQLPAAARRHFLLLFDFAFSSPTAVARAQSAARRFVLEALDSSDLAAVARFTLEDGPQLLVAFTTDRAQLARAIDTLGAPGLFEPEAPAEGNDFERRRVTAWSRSLGEMAGRLAVLPGRKQVLYFSEGFDARLLFGRGPSADDLERRRERRDLEHGEIWRSEPEERFGSGALRAEVDQMLDAFRRADCTLHAIDVAGLRGDRAADGTVATAGAASDDRFGRDALFYLADSTGGELIDATNDLAEALAKTLKTSAVTYLLAFYPERPGQPGEQRRLEVKVKGPRGARILHRPVYTVPKPFADLHPLERELLTTEALLSATPRRDFDLAVLAVPFSTGTQRAYVAVILELAGQDLRPGASDRALPIELYAYATDPEGKMRASFTEKLELDPSQTRKQLAEGLSYYAHLDLEPGDYLLRVLARESTSGRTSVASRKLHVPQPTEPWLSPPLIPTASKALRLREKTEPTERGTVIYPFLDREKPFIPSAKPAITPSERVTFFLICENLPQGDLELEASFEQSTEKRALELRLLERREGEPEMLVLALDPKGLGERDGVLRIRSSGVESAIEISLGKR